jgi:hypothetical protein
MTADIMITEFIAMHYTDHTDAINDLRDRPRGNKIYIMDPMISWSDDPGILIGLVGRLAQQRVGNRRTPGIYRS